ncbi:MAG: hypothetical protein Q9162_007736 [Coniocarpon cinnabarinum]
MFENYNRQVTPPAFNQYLQPHGDSFYADYSPSSFDGSPQSINTQETTPPRSPIIIKQGGPQLLPRVRSQDQNVENGSDAVAHHHRRNTSSLSSSTGFPVDFDPFSDRLRRSVSPGDCNMLTPVSEHAGLQFGPRLSEPPSFPRCSSGESSRPTSTNLDDSAIRKYICPSTRGMPEYITRPSSVPVSHPANSQPSLAPLQPSTNQPAQPNSLPAELLFENYPEPPAATTMLDYLCAPNPSPGLVRRNTVPNRQNDMHYWWDVRNIRTWTDFNLNTINDIPNLASLLDFPVPEPALPTPARVNPEPETLSQLHDAHTTFFNTKVNAALKVCLGTAPLSMRAHKPQLGSKPMPDFLANYDADYERTLTGGVKGRVVGLVRSFNTWNSGMHANGPAAKIEYLRELACLHMHMREHNARYGFIITEIELVCVRAGTDSVPYFGFLELSAPVRLEVSGRSELTASLALWYLHMLAKNNPLPGQCKWQLDVGGPAATTRKNHLERDKWMLKPEGREKRDAKRNRGWVFPDEPLSRKECGKVRMYRR